MNTKNIIAIIGWTTMSIIAVSVIFLVLFDDNVKPVIQDWGGIIIGFYFGSFSTVMLDTFFKKDTNDRDRPVPDDRRPPADPAPPAPPRS